MNASILKKTLAATAALTVAGFASTQLQQPKRGASDWFELPSAQAGKSLDPSSISFSTPAGVGDFARFMYFLVNGAGKTGHSFSGPEGGFAGMINDMTNKLGKKLGEAGYADCASIPTTGSVTKSIEKDGASISMLMTFSTGSKLIPAGYQGAGATFEKRITMSRDGTNVMVFEMTCPTASKPSLKSGYILTAGSMMKQSGKDVSRAMEIYFQRDSGTNESHVDLAQVASGADSRGEKMVTRFATTDGDVFSIHMIRVTSNGGDSFGLWGSSSQKKARINSIHETTTTSSSSLITSVTSNLLSGNVGTFTYCLDFSADAAVESTGCSTAAESTSNSQFNGAALATNSISAVASLAVSTP